MDYRFVSEDEFARLEADGAFIETALVHGNRYGTLRTPVEDALRAGRTVLLEIDIQGARSIRAAFPDALLVFIEPPSFESLAERLRSRGTEDEAAAAERTANARIELAAAGEFDHRIVNDELDRAVVRLLGIIDRYQADPGPATPKETP